MYQVDIAIEERIVQQHIKIILDNQMPLLTQKLQVFTQCTKFYLSWIIHHKTDSNFEVHIF